MDRIPATADPGAWGVAALDLAAYLGRVGHGGDLAPTADTLRALHRAHLDAIAFENLDIVLGRGVDVELEAIQAKLVGRGRGGYCHEHNLLFAAVLERLGFTVHRRLARVGALDPPRPRTHLVARVRDDEGGWWLADVGFGSGLLEPIPLETDRPHRQGGWQFELRATAPGTLELRQREAGEWTAAYRFDDQPQEPADVAVSNFYTSTHPRSPFVNRAVAVRRTADATHRLLDRAYTITRPDGAVEEHQLDDAGVARVLREVFGLALDPAELDRLVAALPPGGPGGSTR